MKLIAGFSLLTKIIADFLFRFYVLNWVFKHAINHIQNCWPQANETEVHI